MTDTSNPRNLDLRSGSCGPGDDWGRAALSTAEAEKEELILRDVDDGIDVANEAASTINARLARLGLQLTEQAVETLWRAVGGLDVVEVEGQTDV